MNRNLIMRTNTPAKLVPMIMIIEVGFFYSNGKIEEKKEKWIEA